MKLDADYEGWAHIRDGYCYYLEDRWDKDNIFYCRYIVYNHSENTIKMYNDDTKTKFIMFFNDIINYYNEECIFSSNPNANSHRLIKIISLEKARCE